MCAAQTGVVLIGTVLGQTDFEKTNDLVCVKSLNDEQPNDPTAPIEFQETGWFFVPTKKAAPFIHGNIFQAVGTKGYSTNFPDRQNSSENVYIELRGATAADLARYRHSIQEIKLSNHPGLNILETEIKAFDKSDTRWVWSYKITVTNTATIAEKKDIQIQLLDVHGFEMAHERLENIALGGGEGKTLTGNIRVALPSGSTITNAVAKFE